MSTFKVECSWCHSKRENYEWIVEEPGWGASHNICSVLCLFEFAVDRLEKERMAAQS